MDLFELERKFKEETSAFQGKISYLYAHMDREKNCFSYQADDNVVSASMIKVPIMMAVFNQMMMENQDLEQKIMIDDTVICNDSIVFEYGAREATIYELIIWMIINSDNTATNALIHYLGMDRLNIYFRNIGLECTKVERRMLDFDAVRKGRNNYISMSDFYQCMKMLVRKEVLNDNYCHLALWIMRQNRDEFCMKRYLYECPQVAHKTGELDAIVHDAGIIYGPRGKYFLGIFISEFEPSHEQEAKKLIGRLSRYVYDSEQSAENQ